MKSPFDGGMSSADPLGRGDDSAAPIVIANEGADRMSLASPIMHDGVTLRACNAA